MLALLRRQFGEDPRNAGFADRLAALPDDEAVNVVLDAASLDDLA